jgi:hypothetical protein
VGFYMPITPYLDDFNVDPKTGERNPDRLCEGALKKLREHLFGD